MIADTEIIMLAWFSLMKGNLGDTFAHYGRRFGFFKDIADQPALLIRKIGDRDEWSGEGLPITTIQGEMWIVQKVKPQEVGETNLNALVTAVRAAARKAANFITGTDGAFITDPDGNVVITDDEAGADEQNIDSLVYRARIEGQSVYDFGDFDGQAKAKIPFTILLPSYDSDDE